MTATHAESGPGMRLYVLIWAGLLAIVGVEVWLTYAGLSPGSLLVSLLLLALVEAAVALLYFMHLRWERPLLAFSFVIILVGTLIMLNHLWRDAHRMVSLHP
jgi:cytochrome c oxidase subunit IV